MEATGTESIPFVIQKLAFLPKIDALGLCFSKQRMFIDMRDAEKQKTVDGYVGKNKFLDCERYI